MVFLALGIAIGSGALAAPAKKPPVRRTPVRVDWTKTVVRTPEGGMRMGNPAAKVKLVEYGSRLCPTCAAFTVNGSAALKSGYVATGQVSYEFRDYPIHGALDIGPILLGRCVPVRAFFPVLEAMMANQGALIGRQTQIPADKEAALQKASPNAVAAYLSNFYGYTDFLVKAGLPAARAKACLADRKAVDAIVSEAAFADKTYGVAVTPTFVVNGVVADKIYDWPSLESALRAAGAG